MKKTIYLLTLIVFSTLILSNTSVKEVAQFFMIVVEDEPILPDEPYAYNEVDFPGHLIGPSSSFFNNDNDTIGYGSGGVDTTVFPLINNDAATLGRVLFYDVNLSSTQDISCGSCHEQALSFTQNVALSDGTNMSTTRNSMHLNDLGWSNREHFGWDLSHENLESLLEVPFNDVNELGIEPEELMIKLNASTFYPALFENAFGTQTIEMSMVIEALADFIKSMNTFNSKLDIESNNGFTNMTTSEMEGLTLFSNNCSGCHFQGEFPLIEIFGSIPLLDIFPGTFNNGLPLESDDIGAGNWNAQFAGLFKAPSLKNIEVTAPYMHDGRFATLDEVIDHYSEDIEENEWTQNSFPQPLTNANFTDTEKANLKAFLLTLTDESFLTDPKWSNPFEAQIIDNTTSIELEKVVLKPNPMSELAIIVFSNETNEQVDITIHSNNGRLIKQDQTNANEYQFQKTDFQPGIYFIKLVMGDKTSTRKLIVQ